MKTPHPWEVIKLYAVLISKQKFEISFAPPNT